MKRNLTAMRKLISYLFVGASLSLGSLYISGLDNGAVFIESDESRTTENGSVFNQIRFQQRADQDIWMMNQSHQGLNAAQPSWDRLAIVVDKAKSPPTARFYQLEPGALDWDPNARKREFRVSCFLCHSNGPRNIRPNKNSNEVPLRFMDKVRIQIWNLRMKSYGRVVYDPVHDDRDKTALSPFRIRSAFENEKLEVGACTKCHNETGRFARGFLTRQNAPTIEFMLAKQHMPPFWFGVSEGDRRQIGEFLLGF